MPDFRFMGRIYEKWMLSILAEKSLEPVDNGVEPRNNLLEESN